MVTIIYPFEDYTAADIAIKMQALASVQQKPIYVVPKHFGRNENTVMKKLSKTKVALLLVYEKNNIDEKTSKELDYLLKKDIPVYAFIPENLNINHPKIIAYKYKPNDKQALYNQLSDFFSSLKPATNDNSGWLDLLVAIGTIAGGLLLLNALTKD